MVAFFQFPAVRVYVHGSKEYLYFQGVFLSEITCLSENTLVLLQTGHLQKLSAERVKSNKRLTVCLHTSESTHLLCN